MPEADVNWHAKMAEAWGLFGHISRMPVSAAYKAFVQDLLSDFGPISIRNMFSGAGLYADGVIFAIIFDDTSISRRTSSSPAPSLPKARAPSPIGARAVRRSPCPIGKFLSACSTILKSS
jgi:DNA transformation protein and related proteins